MAAVPSAADLRGADLGGGSVELRWAHPEEGVLFDVYAGADPLDPFRVRRLAGHAATTATLSGFEQGGEVYFTVVARRGELTALPSRVLRVAVRPVTAPVALVRATPAGRPAGLGFPFGVTAAGSVSTQQGDQLLRGKILQLLLTAPGERVNQPEYGTGLRDLVFDPDNEILAATTEFTVTRALRRFLGDQLEVQSVQVGAAGAELTVDIVYLRTSDLHTERLRVGVPIPR
ncbi:GPW/gp25 family protein [Streptosporangium sp. NPDC005286]|uniref:GPW/gp25 family protein n=1 Tax=Streptosporangium sp. NPDC005286 TaxID=3154463 RepID=UPI0033A74C2F